MRWLRSAARVAVRARGKETPSESRSSRADEEVGEDEEELEIISSPHSPSPETLSSPDDVFSQLVGIPTSVHRVKCPHEDAGGASVISWF
jgi:hypothetical protein